MKQLNYLLLLLAIGCFALTSCKKDKKDEPDPNALIDPADANALSAVLIMPAGTQTDNGTTPSPSSNNNAPEVTTLNSALLSSNGSTAILNFTYAGVNGNLGGCYAQVDGANSYFILPYSGSSGAAGELQLPIGIPTNVDAGEFCVVFSVFDANGLVSNTVIVCVNVLRLGTGALQISLSWDKANDQDLHVFDPSGEEIDYTNTSSLSGGQLDRDDLDGFGPENIYWLENAPDGTYQVKVDDYAGTGANFYVTVSGPNVSRNFSGTTSNGNTVDVVTFTKSGNSINF